MEKQGIPMTDLEFDVMDELYFVISFHELKEKVGIGDHDLKKVLGGLVKKSYVRCLKNISDELPHDELDFEHNYGIYHYLASKEGLLAHNSR